MAPPATRSSRTAATEAGVTAVVRRSTRNRASGASTNGNDKPSPAPASVAPSRLLPGALALLVWAAFSSSIIMTNKRVYSGGFPYPCALTAVGSGFSALAAALFARVASAVASSSSPLFRLRSPRELLLSPTFLSWVLPVAVATALSMALGNFPYLYLSVSFIQMLKASSPAWTLVLAAAAGLEKATAALAASVGLIAAGTAATVLFQEQGDEGGLIASEAGGSAAAFGVALTLMSCVAEAARVVGAQVLLQKQQQQKRRKQQQPPPPPLNALESLVYVGGPASLLLLLASLLLREGGSPRGLFLAAAAFARRRPTTALAAVASSAAVNLASVVAVALTSSLTFKVSGCAKNAAVMALAAAEHGDRVTSGQVGGYALATLGFVAYACVKGRGGGRGGGGGGGAGGQRGEREEREQRQRRTRRQE